MSALSNQELIDCLHAMGEAFIGNYVLDPNRGELPGRFYVNVNAGAEVFEVALGVRIGNHFQFVTSTEPRALDVLNGMTNSGGVTVGWIAVAMQHAGTDEEQVSVMGQMLSVEHSDRDRLQFKRAATDLADLISARNKKPGWLQ